MPQSVKLSYLYCFLLHTAPQQHLERWIILLFSLVRLQNWIIWMITESVWGTLKTSRWLHLPSWYVKTVTEGTWNQTTPVYDLTFCCSRSARDASPAAQRSSHKARLLPSTSLHPSMSHKPPIRPRSQDLCDAHRDELSTSGPLYSAFLLVLWGICGGLCTRAKLFLKESDHEDWI